MTIIEKPAYPANYGNRKRGAKPLFCILHDTAGTADSAVNWFQNPASMVSAHYIVARTGSIYRCVPEANAAWHAGMSEFMGYESLNDWSIGIEMEDQDDKDLYPDAQLLAVLEITEDVIRRYQIPLNRVVGHCDIATPRGRKIDPGGDFPWFSFLNVLGARLAVSH